MKSYDQTWLGRVAGRFQIAFSAVPCGLLPRVLALPGRHPMALEPPQPLDPFAVHQPAVRSQQHSRPSGSPSAGDATASSFIAATSRSSYSAGAGAYRCVERC